ncbi:MAG: hypothetical protein FJX76_00545 [Armatimonadetes bacterium]|nr:hypothetical protein [Armatimonadota bacterium]
MKIPLNLALYGISLIKDMFFSGGQDAAAPRRPNSSQVQAPVEDAFEQSMRMAQMLSTAGDRINATEHQRLGQLVGEGNIPQALALLEQITAR